MDRHRPRLGAEIRGGGAGGCGLCGSESIDRFGASGTGGFYMSDRPTRFKYQTLFRQ